MTTQRSTYWLVIAFVIGSFSVAFPDHFPASKLALGNPEHVLGGVDVYSDKIASVIARLGKPAKTDSTTSPDYPRGSGERSYEWRSEGVRLRVGTEYRTDQQTGRVIESAPMVVDVWGSGGGRLAKTGRGLALGDQIATAKSAYGSRYERDSHSITFQWKDETTLVMDLDDSGRVVHMQLLAATE